MAAKPRYGRRILILIGLSYVFLMLGNGLLSLTIPDEVFYVQTAKEMANRHSWMTPYLFDVPQFEKPILLYWLLRLGFILFGITSFASRFFPSLFAIAGAVTVYLLGIAGFRDEKKAFIASLVVMSSGVYIGLARTVFTDMIFSVLITMSLASFYWGYVRPARKTAGILLCFMFSACAVLAKGPLGFVIPLLAIAAFTVIKRDARFLLCRSTFWGFLLFLAIALPWYLSMTAQYGSSFTHEFFYNDHYRRLIEAEHSGNDTWYFYPFSMISCMFPWSIYVIAAFAYLVRDFRRNPQPFGLFLLCWIGAVFLVFEPAHSKLVSYIFPLFPALALVTGNYIYDASSRNSKSSQVVSLLTFFIFLLLPVAVFIVSAKHPQYLSSKIPVYGFIVALCVLSFTLLFFIVRRTRLKAAYVVAVANLLTLAVIPFVRIDLEPYLSPRDICDYLLTHYKVDNTILCSKFFVRGVYYYTGKKVAVIDVPGKPFFSPHPIPFLNSDTKVRDFLRAQTVTYCILKKSSLEDIDRAIKGEFKSTLLIVLGNEYLVKIERS